jgi:protein-S-isoprenylcysteine O-methyltransferase Ste14
LIGWRQIYRGNGELVNTGLYRKIRHPQYAGFFLFLVGSIINWPTLITLLMLPVLMVVYYRLAKEEEADALAQFGDEYRRYQAITGMFWPRLRS